MRGILVILIAVVVSSCSTSKLTAQRIGKNDLFTTDYKVLERNKAAVKNNDPLIMPAYKQLIKDAEKALQYAPVSVMEKTNNPPSGDKHDYMSLAPYFWPDSSKPNGLPYLRRDGQTNPEVKEYKDKDYMPKICAHVESLALAYYFSEENFYAEHAAKLMRVWFLDTATRMNPNLNYGQAIKGKNDGRGAGLIDTRHFVKLINGIGIIKSSKSWKAADQKGMRQWFADFLDWMQTSKVGMDEMKAPNNHGAWYDAQRLAMALFIDSARLAKEIVANAANRLDYQVDEKGFYPKEMERTISLHYSAFVMDAFFNIAKMSERTGFDFWNHTTPSGKSLKLSFNALKPYFANEKAWFGEQIKPYDFEDSHSLLMEAYEHFKCKDCQQVVKQLADEKAPRLRLNLLY